MKTIDMKAGVVYLYVGGQQQLTVCYLGYENDYYYFVPVDKRMRISGYIQHLCEKEVEELIKHCES